jgi:hypothetical protein
MPDEIDFQVTDDSGFMALLDPDAYSGFVAENWALDDLVARFRDEMAANHLLIWGTGQEGSWTVRISRSSGSKTGVRELSGSIVASKGRLLLTNYESLTMAAQFEDVMLPEPHAADLVIAVPPGAYRCRIVQYALEAANWRDGCEPEFGIELQPATSPDAAWTGIPWSDL